MSPTTTARILMSSGIYKIVNNLNGKFYVGSSTNLHKRESDHFSGLRRGNHPNLYLQRSYNTYGEENFTFCILETCEIVYLLEREQHYIDTLNPEYNISRVAGNTLGYKHTKETLEHLRSIKVGIPLSEKHKASLTGRTFSDEHKANLSSALAGNDNCKGFIHTKETRDKISSVRMGNKNCVGYKHTEEAKLNMSLAHKGVGTSAETRLKMSLAHKGKKMSEETKLKLSIANKGKKHKMVVKSSEGGL